MHVAIKVVVLGDTEADGSSGHLCDGHLADDGDIGEEGRRLWQVVLLNARTAR